MHPIKELDHFYLQQPEPVQGCYLALRDIILAQDTLITAEWKYKLPFFYYKGKPLCYLWTDKKTNHPYLAMMEGKHIYHRDLHCGDRVRIKSISFNPDQNLPLEIIVGILQQGLEVFRTGVVKIK
ncbi:DUF1801 domain-containing protein [Mucilaginibacter antarcticus]|uniref:DUF1801 domain-containing protein n=1 Tax=Mucilaginibacter antarcticus TaxID=1855725 RepID=A0ABW5XU95_9SPHI